MTFCAFDRGDVFWGVAAMISLIQSRFTTVAGAFAMLCVANTFAVSAPIGEAEVPSGKDLFLRHCAQCHGEDGAGNGPMASVLTVKPADLTTLSKRANGKFDAQRIAEIIRYGGNISGHGTRAMPIWGLIFSIEGEGGKIGASYSRIAVIKLKNYLQSIQKK